MPHEPGHVEDTTPEQVPDPVEVKKPLEEKVKEEIVKPENKDKFIPVASEIVKDEETGDKYVTITISSKILHFLFSGLGKYKEGFKSDNESDIKERDDANKIIDELTEVKAILNEEKIDKKVKQEPNPVEMTEGTTEDPDVQPT